MDELDRSPDFHFDALFEHDELEQPWRDIYGSMVSELRAEASGLPMNTMLTTLIERIAYQYVFIRMAEREDSENRFNTRAQKEYNDFWLKMLQEFHKILNSGTDKIREALLLEIRDMVKESTDLIEDNNVRKRVRLSLSEGFAKIDAPGVNR